MDDAMNLDDLTGILPESRDKATQTEQEEVSDWCEIEIPFVVGWLIVA